MPPKRESVNDEGRGKFRHPVTVNSDAGRREEAEFNDSSIEEHPDYQEEIGSHEETSSETTEYNGEMHKKVQNKVEMKDNLQVDSSHDTIEPGICEKKTHMAMRREKLLNIKMYMMKAQSDLEVKLAEKVSEDDMERLCDELTQRLKHKTEAYARQNEGFIPISRPPSPDEEPDWMKDLRIEEETAAPSTFGAPNRLRGDACVTQLEHIPRQMRRRRIRSFSFTESHCESGETHLVTVKKFIGDPMDKHLETIGFVKRSIPQDGNSLYRVICEELFLCQRQEDIALVKKWIHWMVELEYKIQRIRKGRENVEKDGNKDQLRAAAKLFRARISVYTKPNQMPFVYDPPKGITPEIEISMCEIEPNFFERVTERVTAEKMGIAQAVVYQKVVAFAYGLDKETIRHCIQRVRIEMGVAGDPLSVYPHLPPPTPLWIPEHSSYCRSTPTKFRPPVQFCKIKCMDPRIYRNIPCDSFFKELKKNKAKCEKPDQFPVGTSVVTKIRGLSQQAEVVANHDEKNKVLRFEDGVIGLVPTYTMQNDSARNQKKPVPPKILLKHNGRPQQHVLPPVVPPVLPPSVNPLHSPVNYILEPLTWNMCPSPPVSPMCIPPPGMLPMAPIMPCPVQPQSPFVPCSMPGQTIYVTPAFGTSPICSAAHPMPSMNPQHIVSVPEQIMANYNRFPFDPSHQMPLNPRFVQTPPIPIPPASNRCMISQMDIPRHGTHSSVQPPFSPASMASSVGEESDISSSSSNFEIADVPFFTHEEKKEVSKKTTYSANADGSDLPQDASTLRYYFNLGISTSHRKHGQKDDSANRGAPSSHLVPDPSGNFVVPPTTPFVYGMHSIRAPTYGPVSSSVMHSVPPPPAGLTYVNGTAYYSLQATAKEPEV